jgi:hypothetical protein
MRANDASKILKLKMATGCPSAVDAVLCYENVTLHRTNLCPSVAKTS